MLADSLPAGRSLARRSPAGSLPTPPPLPPPLLPLPPPIFSLRPPSPPPPPPGPPPVSPPPPPSPSSLPTISPPPPPPRPPLSLPLLFPPPPPPRPHLRPQNRSPFPAILHLVPPGLALRFSRLPTPWAPPSRGGAVSRGAPPWGRSVGHRNPPPLPSPASPPRAPRSRPPFPPVMPAGDRYLCCSTSDASTTATGDSSPTPAVWRRVSTSPPWMGWRSSTRVDQR